MKIIPLDPIYTFALLEDKNDCLNTPLSNYYLKLDDLSINLIISLKWVLWGYKFMSDLSKELDELENYDLFDIIEKSIQSPLTNI